MGRTPFFFQFINIHIYSHRDIRGIWNFPFREERYTHIHWLEGVGLFLLQRDTRKTEGTTNKGGAPFLFPLDNTQNTLKKKKGLHHGLNIDPLTKLSPPINTYGFHRRNASHTARKRNREVIRENRKGKEIERERVKTVRTRRKRGGCRSGLDLWLETEGKYIEVEIWSSLRFFGSRAPIDRKLFRIKSSIEVQLYSFPLFFQCLWYFVSRIEYLCVVWSSLVVNNYLCWLAVDSFCYELCVM